MAAVGKKQNRRGVLICGAYGMSNTGDEAVLEAVLAEMRSIDPDMPITVLSRNPAATAANHGVASIHMFDVPGFLRAMRGCRLYINGGGSLIQDATSSRSLWYYLYTLWAARRRGCRVLMYGCGIGPVTRPLNRFLAGRIIDRNVDAITLRGARSLDELRAFGVKRPEILLASDPALFLQDAPAEALNAALEDIGLTPDGSYFGICVRRWPGMEEKLPLFAAAADHAYQTYGLRPVLLTVNADQDEALTHRLQTLIQAPCVLAEKLPLGVMAGAIGRLRCVLSMRLHVLVFAAARSVPLAAVSYDPKVASFLEDLGQNNAVDYGELRTAAQLLSLVDAAATADSAALTAATARIMALERRNTETARRLLERED